MAKVVWINPIFTGGTSLDLAINSHDVERISLTEILQSEGHEVWLHDVAVSRRKFSSFPNRVSSEDLKDFKADIAILTVGEFAWDYLAFRYFEEQKTNGSRAKGVDAAVEWLDKFTGPLYAIIFDPRPSFQKVFVSPKGNHPLYPHLDRASIIVPDTSFLDESLKDRAVISDYWKTVKTGKIRPFNPSEDFFCVIPMMKRQTVVRKRMIRDWCDIENCWTAGPVQVSEVQSLSDHKMVPLSWVLDTTERSTTSLIFGEPTHTWLTPRVIQSLTCGTIATIHPDFAGRDCFPKNIAEEQTFRKASEFNKSLLCQEIYDRQVEFVKELRSQSHKSGVRAS